MVLVWLPEYMHEVFKTDRNLPRYIKEAGDLSERMALRDRMQCKSMDWYMDIIYPELRQDMRKSFPAR